MVILCENCRNHLLIAITLLAFIENCLPNNCLIMITTKTNICLSKFIDADWWRYLTSYLVAIDQKLSCDIEIIFVQNSYSKDWTPTTSVTGPYQTKFLAAPLPISHFWKTCQIITYMPHGLFSCHTTFKKTKFLEFA